MLFRSIDSFQATYFVIDSFNQLFDMTAPDFSGMYRELQELADFEAGEQAYGDQTVSRR